MKNNYKYVRVTYVITGRERECVRVVSMYAYLPNYSEKYRNV